MPPRQRRLAAIMTVSLLGFFILLVGVDTGLTRPADQWVSLHIEKWWSPAVTQVMTGVTDLCRPLVLGGIAVAIGVVLLLRKRWFAAFPALMGVAGGAFLVLPIKELVHRPRPEASLLAISGYSFPSDHAAVALLFFGLLLILVIPWLKQKASRWLLIGFSSVAVAFISFTRVYLGVHWFSDIIGGWLLGLGWLCTSLFLANFLQDHGPHHWVH